MFDHFVELTLKELIMLQPTLVILGIVAESYRGPLQTSKIESFAVVAVTIVRKLTVLDVMGDLAKF